MFSKACEYGIRATLYIAMNSLDDKRVSLRTIAGKIDSPEAFTAKILQQLVHHAIINSVKGATGGFEIEKEKLRGITLAHIISAIDGDNLFHGCVMGLSACTESHPCPAHISYEKIRSQLKSMLNNTSIYDLSHGLETGLTFLKQ
ncbi:MAG: Rrf2 family transcriptional regulator [Saprospiraceae bacterium]|nr:Rrf2 family transcriptional regulator [Saprospiraceae bacterium]